MKKLIVLAGAVLTAFVVAGCNQENQGGTSDQYGTGTGSESNYNQYSQTNNMGGATSPGGMDTNNATGGTNNNVGAGTR